MEDKYICLKLTKEEIAFLKEQLAFRQATITEELNTELQDELSSKTYELNVYKRTCERLRNYIEYALREK